ncbi:MAG TPA: hypothetical protein VFB70_09165 [Pyrinomonadaceae bacterium]|nr:hypothetical protein [Pyrinomonadaceae bacterium]
MKNALADSSSSSPSRKPFSSITELTEPECGEHPLTTGASLVCATAGLATSKVQVRRSRIATLMIRRRLAFG